jgi:hypothetical protein
MKANDPFATPEEPGASVASLGIAISHSPVRSRSLSRPMMIGLLVVLAMGALVRAWNFPRYHEVRDMDETGYMSSGLVLWEGMIPGFHASQPGRKLGSHGPTRR